MKVLPIFRSSYSYGGLSLLTLEESGLAKPGNPLSVFDCAKEADLREVVILDDRIDGFLHAYKTAKKENRKLIYGLRLVVCPDMADKTPESVNNESSIIIFVRNYQGYKDLLKIQSRAWGHEGFFSCRIGGKEYSHGRTDWDLLKKFWTPNLVLAFPFFSSFLAKNTLSLSSITPDLSFFKSPWFLRETDSGLPFEHLISEALGNFLDSHPEIRTLPSKTICYPKKSDMETYITFRAHSAKGNFGNPEVRHLASDNFSFEDWKRLNNV